MITIKQGDTRHAIRATFSEDLTDCNVLVSLEKNVHRASCVIEDAINGKVVFPLETSMTEKTGVFRYEFIVVYPDGRECTAPNDGYLNLKILKEVE